MKYKATYQPQDFVDATYSIKVVGSKEEVGQILEIIAGYEFRIGSPEKMFFRKLYKGYACKFYSGEIPDIVPEMKKKFGNGVPPVQERVRQDHERILSIVRDKISNVDVTECVRKEIIHDTGP